MECINPDMNLDKFKVLHAYVACEVCKVQYDLGITMDAALRMQPAFMFLYFRMK